MKKPQIGDRVVEEHPTFTRILEFRDHILPNGLNYPSWHIVEDIPKKRAVRA